MATPEVTLAPPFDDPDDTSIFENKSGLADDMRFLASMPELCDVTFLVGDTLKPVCAVKVYLSLFKCGMAQFGLTMSASVLFSLAQLN